MLKLINIFVKNVLKLVNMNVKIKSLTVGALFFLGGATVMAQQTKEKGEKEIEEVVVVGYGKQKKSEVTSSITKISGDALKNLITPSFESQLAGRAAGVQVTTQNGIVGAAPRVIIRGLSSINSGTRPLYVVDGMPIYSGDLGGYADANGLGDINPNDIESFEVLKDGAATAIYGSRAANGVILITTKKGKSGKMQVNFNSVNGFAFPFKTFDLLETPDFLTISNEKRKNAGQPDWAAGTAYNTDWQKAVLNRGAMQSDHSLSMQGGNESTKYYFSIGHTSQEGIAKSNEMKRYSVRANMEHKFAKWLTFGGNIGVTKTDYSGINTGTSSLSGNIFNAMRQLPNTPIYDPNNPTGYNINLSTGNMGQWDNIQPVGDNISNIVYVLDKNKFQSNIMRTLLNLFLDVEIGKGLTYRLQTSTDNSSTEGFRYWDPTHGDGRSTNGRLNNNNTNQLRWNVQNILTYNKSFESGHSINFTGVVETQKEKNKSFFGTGTNLLSDFYNQGLVTGAYANQESGGGITEVGIMSYVARLSYNYKQKYFLQGSVRRDGISKLSPNTRWENFVGYSAGWNIAKEGFFSALNKTINEFKVRGSYSETGNTEIGTYPYFGLTSASKYGSLNGIAFTQFGNDKLKWESSKKMDFGADLGFLDNKVRLTFDYFQNDIDGLILEARESASLGLPDNKVTKNIGEMMNKGYEFGIDYRVIEKENFSWNLNANLTLQENKVLKTFGGSDIIGGSSTDSNIMPNIIIREGYSINSLYGYIYWGVNPANGAPVYVKADGTLVQGSNISSSGYTVFDPNNPTDTSKASSLVQADKRILGNTVPKYFGGFNSKLKYNNIDFSFLIRFSGGNKVFNATRRDLMNLNLNNNSEEILGRWQSVTNPGDGWTPKLYANQNTFINQTSNATTRFVEKGDFISMDNITLGYSFPNSLINKLNIRSLRIFVQGQNMFMISKYKGLDPEMETSGVDLNGTPRATVYSFGINLNL